MKKLLGCVVTHHSPRGFASFMAKSRQPHSLSTELQTSSPTPPPPQKTSNIFNYYPGLVRSMALVLFCESGLSSVFNGVCQLSDHFSFRSSFKHNKISPANHGVFSEEPLWCIIREKVRSDQRKFEIFHVSFRCFCLPNDNATLLGFSSFFTTDQMIFTMWPSCHVTIRSLKLPERTFIMTYIEQEMWTVLYLQVCCFAMSLIWFLLRSVRGKQTVQYSI